jgi:hypothetical protein
MLDKLKKKLGIVPANQEASQEVTNAGEQPEQQKEETMSDEKATVELATHEAVVTELAAMKTEMESFKAATEAMKAEYEEKLTKYAAAEEQAKADALQIKMDARMAKLKESVGDTQAETLMAATKDLDDAAFDKIAGAVAATYDAEANSQMFTEKGVDAEVKEPAQVDMVTRLAAKINAEFAPKKDAK